MRKKSHIVGSAIFISAVFLGIYVLAESLEEKSLAPLPKPPAALKEKEVALGKMLFFDTRLSGDATLSCASCHIPQKAFTDGEALSAGYPSTLYFRNTPTALNSAFKKLLYWDGRLPGNDLATLVRDHISEAHFLQADGRLVIERLRQVPEYEQMFKEAYGGAPSYGKILNALAAYLQSLNSQEVGLDKYLTGDKNALSPGAQKGLGLFKGKARCIQCHYGPMLTDESFHNLGVLENPEVYEDPLRHITFRRFFKTLGVEGYHTLKKDVGRYALTKEEKDRGKFKTPSLREVAKTAPYMHNGTFKTLDEVVEFYNQGGGSDKDKESLLKPLRLSEKEKKELVEFLKSLSGKSADEQAPPLPEYQLRELGKN